MRFTIHGGDEMEYFTPATAPLCRKSSSAFLYRRPSEATAIDAVEQMQLASDLGDTGHDAGDSAIITNLETLSMTELPENLSTADRPESVITTDSTAARMSSTESPESTKVEQSSFVASVLWINHIGRKANTLFHTFVPTRLQSLATNVTSRVLYGVPGARSLEAWAAQKATQVGLDFTLQLSLSTSNMDVEKDEIDAPMASQLSTLRQSVAMAHITRIYTSTKGVVSSAFAIASSVDNRLLVTMLIAGTLRLSVAVACNIMKVASRFVLYLLFCSGIGQVLIALFCFLFILFVPCLAPNYLRHEHTTY
ncbi:hypothetical protein HDU97_008732 [Phlyctochytrium planicorne]|nr:hypothetical protein HDU97_008732 [Phlyctochytrium planicorne]